MYKCNFIFALRPAFVVGCLMTTVVYVHESQAGEMEEVVVTAHPLSGEGISQASKVLVGEELERKLASNIGATLAQEPGIHSAQFGSAVGRPVIHGLGGPRVRVMEDRIDSLDLSVTSADHAVTIEPFVAERIEILKGSSTLLYGSGAIGGVIDIHTARIPHALPESLLSGGVETRFNDNTNGQTSSAKLNGSVGNLAWHLDGTRKAGDDYDIPGFAESSLQRATETGEGSIEEEVRGYLPGSEYDVTSYAGGLSYIADWGFVGGSVGQFGANYGLPGGHAEEGAEVGATPSLDMEQTRTDIELGVKDPFATFSSLNIRFGHNSYAHQEIEPNGEVATNFNNDAWELRTELVYDTGAWHGVVGFQHTDRKFSALGEEAFVPPVDTRDTGIFWVAEREFDAFNIETGLRISKVKHEPRGGMNEQFTTLAASLGWVISLSEGMTLGLVSDYAERAPVSEELFSNGPHLVTGAYEIGDSNLDIERALNFAITLTQNSQIWSASLTGYQTQFIDFIYEKRTDEIQDGLPVFQFQQDNATFYGVDFAADIALAQWIEGRFGVRGMFDLVHARLDVGGNDNLPRIPPSRYGVGLYLELGPLLASLDFSHVLEQDKVAENEFISYAYDDLRAHVSVEFPLQRGSLNLFVSAKNLTNDEQRFHTSFIKDFAPAPGRAVEAGVRLFF